jgi:hypothetical protein
MVPSLSLRTLDKMSLNGELWPRQQPVTAVPQCGGIMLWKLRSSLHDRHQRVESLKFGSSDVSMHWHAGFLGGFSLLPLS